MRERGVLILHNVPDARQNSDQSAWSESDAGVLGEVEAVGAGEEPIVFNLVEALGGDAFDFTFVPEICKAMGKGCTGNDGACQSLCLDKWRTSAVLRACGVPTPPSVLVPVGVGAAAVRLPEGRLIVKPSCADASEGIDAGSVVDGPGPALDAAVARVHSQFGQAAIVEQFIDGREINVAMVEHGGKVDVLPLSEIEFTDFPSDQPRIVGYTAKWKNDSFECTHTPRLIPAPLPEETAAEIRRMAVAAWHALGCRDYVRVDFRVDTGGRPFVLEVNPNPDVSANDGFSSAVKVGGIEYEDFVLAMVENALGRIRKSAPHASAEAPVRPSKAHPVTIRPSVGEDRKPILRMVVDSGFFRPDEVAIAREVLDDSLTRGAEMGYFSYTAELDGKPAGWVCYGPTACTVGTFDIYWIVVSPDFQRAGIGSALLEQAEALIAGQGGRVTVIETSGRPLYRSTRYFYEKRGYRESARIPDFYAPGDDKLVFTKALASPR